MARLTADRWSLLTKVAILMNVKLHTKYHALSLHISQYPQQYFGFLYATEPGDLELGQYSPYALAEFLKTVAILSLSYFLQTVVVSRQTALRTTVIFIECGGRGGKRSSNCMR